MSPLLILIVGIVVVIGLIIVLRVHAFIALITAAIVVSLLSPGPLAEKISRVAEAFGSAAGSIGIVIALAAVIGTCLMESGAADRIVRAFLRVLGEKRASWALMGSGFVLSVPVFFDTVFYLLVPLARSLCQRTQKNYLLYLLAICAGGCITHTLVPPTPGPLAIANEFKVDLGLMILVGTLVALPTAIIALMICKLMNRVLDIPMRPYRGEPAPDPLADEQLPPLGLSLLPVLLPVIMISLHTIVSTCAEQVWAPDFMKSATRVTGLLGNPNLALLISAVIAMGLLVWKRSLSLKELTQKVDQSLMSGGVIILITAGGGAFGKMLRAAGIKDAIEGQFAEAQHAGMMIFIAAFAVAAMLKFAQGSSTVAMITTASMFAAMKLSTEVLGCHHVYLATTIGAGSLVGSWMNDSGFWIVSRMGVLSEGEALKVWTPLLASMGFTAFGFTLLLSRIWPMLG